MKAYLFPGQGSQVIGMGRDLFDSYKSLTDIADEILGYSIKDLCVRDPDKTLNETQFTQPALYVVNALSYRRYLDQSESQPNYVAGHSLGEFNALLAAEAFSFEEGLLLVQKRGELMSRSVGGGMAAILNSSKDEVELILKDSGLASIDVANYNTSSQIVISGLKSEIVRAEPFFQRGNLGFFPLNTSGAFHSKHMQDASEEFSVYLNKLEASDLKIPVISNVSGKPYQNDEVREKLAAQLTHPVQWFDSIQCLISLGVTEFEEASHSSVLTKMVSQIKKESFPPSSVQSEKGNEVGGGHSRVVEPIASREDSGMENDKETLTVGEKVGLWNKKRPVGTGVKSLLIGEQSLRTRTKAMVLFGQRAAVYIEGYNGYFDLDELLVMDE